MLKRLWRTTAGHFRPARLSVVGLTVTAMVAAIVPATAARAATATSLSNVAVSLTGVTAAAGARSGYSVSFTTSATGGLSQADGSSWTVSFPAGSDICHVNSVTVTDVTTNQGVGGSGCNSNTSISGTFNGGVVINPGDTLRVDINGAYNPTTPASGYTVQAYTSSDTTPVTSANSFAIVAQNPVSNVAVSLTGVTAAAGARSGYSVSFTTSATGGLSQADGSSWTVSFPAGSDICHVNSVTVTDVTTNQGVGGSGCNSNTSISGTFNGGVVINPGDTLRVDINGAYNPTTPASGYTVQAYTSSDTTPVTSANSFAIVAQNPVSNVAVSLTGVTAAAGARSGYSVSFTTSATGGLSQADGSSWTVSFPAGSDICHVNSVTVTDVTTNQGVGGSGCNSNTSISGTFNGGVVINPGDTLRVDINGAYNPTTPASGYTVQAYTSSDTTPVTSANSFAIVAQNPVSNVAVSLTGVTAAAGAVRVIR